MLRIISIVVGVETLANLAKSALWVIVPSPATLAWRNATVLVLMSVPTAATVVLVAMLVMLRRFAPSESVLRHVRRAY